MAGAKQKRVARVAGSEAPLFSRRGPVRAWVRGRHLPIVLTRCDGRPAPEAVEQLSHPGAPHERAPSLPAHHAGAACRRSARVAPRRQARRRRSRGSAAEGHRPLPESKVTVVSGYRPRSLGSFHQSAKAIDFHVDGVSHEASWRFCRTLADTGCGYYPNSSFVHMDVPPARTGHVYWIDASGPGETPLYVSAWPPRAGQRLRAAVNRHRIPRHPPTSRRTSPSRACRRERATPRSTHGPWHPSVRPRKIRSIP